VTADVKILTLQMDADSRLAAAAGAIANFLAASAGLADSAAGELQTSVLAACLAAFENLAGERAHLTVVFSWYLDDRIEIALQSRAGVGPAVGLDRIAGLAGAFGGAGTFSGIDRVQYEGRDGAAVTRLTKYLGHAPHIA
jgi:hypothetical protein